LYAPIWKEEIDQTDCIMHNHGSSFLLSCNPVLIYFLWGHILWCTSEYRWRIHWFTAAKKVCSRVL